jgi:hypothetical protein
MVNIGNESPVENDDSLIYIIVGAVGGCCCLLALVGLIVFLVRRNNNGSNNNNNNDNTPTTNNDNSYQTTEFNQQPEFVSAVDRHTSALDDGGNSDSHCKSQCNSSVISQHYHRHVIWQSKLFCWWYI